MERIQLGLRGEMDFITAVTSELKDRKNFNGQNLLAPDVNDFITVFELKLKLKKKRLQAGYTVPRECPSSSSTSDLSSSSQKPEILRGSN